MKHLERYKKPDGGYYPVVCHTCPNHKIFNTSNPEACKICPAGKESKNVKPR